MSAPIHPRWKSTDATPVESAKKGISSPVTAQRINDVPVHHVAISGSGHRFFPMLSVVSLSVVLLAGTFLGGVQFLRADLLSDQNVAQVQIEGGAESSTVSESEDIISEIQNEQSLDNASVPPTIDLTHTQQTSVSAWPASLRINPRTALNAIPSFAPVDQMPIHVIRDTERKVHRSAPLRNIANAQPQTGPLLWIVAFLSACSLPFVLRKKAAC